MISAAIKSLIAEYGMSPWEINNGDCENFALDLIEMVGGEDWGTESLGNYELWEILPGHVWVYLDGKHYDSECPEGVDTPLELPIFARFLETLSEKERKTFFQNNS